MTAMRARAKADTPPTMPPMIMGMLLDVGGEVDFGEGVDVDGMEIGVEVGDIEGIETGMSQPSML